MCIFCRSQGAGVCVYVDVRLLRALVSPLITFLFVPLGAEGPVNLFFFCFFLVAVSSRVLWQDFIGKGANPDKPRWMMYSGAPLTAAALFTEQQHNR